MNRDHLWTEIIYVQRRISTKYQMWNPSYKGKLLESNMQTLINSLSKFGKACGPDQIYVEGEGKYPKDHQFKLTVLI